MLRVDTFQYSERVILRLVFLHRPRTDGVSTVGSRGVNCVSSRDQSLH